MITLETIREEFPNANYAPNPNCKYCNGTGSTGPKKVIVVTNDGAYTKIDETRRQACVCIFVGGGERIHDLVIGGLRKIAKEELAHLRGPADIQN
jgi:hypothetical protein